MFSKGELHKFLTRLRIDFKYGITSATMKRQKKNKQIKKPVQKFSQKTEQKTQPVQVKNIFFDTYIAAHTVKIFLLLATLIGFFAFYKFLTFEHLFFFKGIGSDSINLDLPYAFHRVRMHGEAFVSKWSFYTGMGMPFYTPLPPDPINFLLRLINSIGMSVFGVDFLLHQRFYVKFIIYFLLTGVIFYYYFRTISINKFSSLTGALLITFCGFIVVGASWNFAFQVFNLGFLLFSFEQLYLKNRWYFFPIAVMMLSTNVFLLYLNLFFFGVYFLFRFFSDEQNTLKSFLTSLSKIFVLTIAGLLINSVSIMRSFMQLFFSPRGSGSVAAAESTTEYSLKLADPELLVSGIYRFFSSDIIGTGLNFSGWSNYLESPMFYIGLLTLLIFPQVWGYLSKRQKIVYSAFFSFWLLTFFVPYFRQSILLFTGDYFRFGFNFFIPFAFLLFAVQALNEIDKNFKINLPLLISTLVLLTVLLFFPYSAIQQESVNQTLQKVIFVFLLLYAGIIFLMSKPEYKNFAQIALILVLCVELAYLSYNSYNDRNSLTKKEYLSNFGGYNDGSIDAVNYIKSADNAAFYRIEKDYQSGNAMHGSLNDAMAQGYFGTTSYSSFNQLNYIRFQEEIGLIQKGDETATRWSTGFRGNPLLQTFGNVKYHLSKEENPAFIRFGFEPIDTIAGVKVLKNKYFLPFGYTYDSYITFDDFKSLIEYRISEQSLNNLYTDLSRSIPQTELNALLPKLQALTDSTFQTEAGFDAALENIAGISAPNIRRSIKKYSTVNFKNQMALLNAFVYEEEMKTDTSLFKKISPTDTSVIVPPQKFNFDLYENFVSKLKEDTFKISEFENSRISGSIELNKTKMLFFTIPYDEGWTAVINGEKTELERVNTGFTGIVLPAGKHQIILEYHPPFSQAAQAVSYISALLFWLYLAYYLFRKYKKKKRSEKEA